ncbi:MAG TPA: hypothetical protein VGV35_10805 [Bryobacteraceae bacterium]|nr:hypothetical protein [Bryobacteraceae bacterium]
MPDVLVHKASDLKPQTRAAIEAEFGRALRDDEEISIAARLPSETAAGTTQLAALRRLEALYARTDEKTKDIPEEEIEQILLEAIRSARPGYEEHR